VRFESFMEEFSNILQRQAPRQREPAEPKQEAGARH
jgi:hypothetical protein